MADHEVPPPSRPGPQSICRSPDRTKRPYPGNNCRLLIGYTHVERFRAGDERDEVVMVGARLGTQDLSVRRADWRCELASVPAPRAVPVETDLPRPRWSQEVGAAVLLSVIGTVREQGATTSA